MDRRTCQIRMWSVLMRKCSGPAGACASGCGIAMRTQLDWQIVLVQYGVLARCFRHRSKDLVNVRILRKIHCNELECAAFSVQ